MQSPETEIPLMLPDEAQKTPPPVAAHAPPPDSPAGEPLTSDIADGATRTMHPNFVRVERLTGWIFFAVITVILIGGGGVWLWIKPPPVAVIAGIAAAVLSILALLAWTAQCWPAIDHRHRSYRLDDQGIEIRKGVLWRTVLNVPRSRVQHTDVNQGPIERRYGLAHLVIHTAGTISANVTLEGLDRPTAVRIRDHLVETGGGDAV